VTVAARPWAARAACAGLDTGLWYPSGDASMAEEQGAEARRICAGCPVQQQCLDWAMETREKFGIFGGLDEHERQNLRRRQQRVARKLRALEAAS